MSQGKLYGILSLNLSCHISLKLKETTFPPIEELSPHWYIIWDPLNALSASEDVIFICPHTCDRGNGKPMFGSQQDLQYSITIEIESQMTKLQRQGVINNIVLG